MMKTRSFRTLTFILAAFGTVCSWTFSQEPQTQSSPTRIWHKASFPDTENCQAILFDPLNTQRILIGSRPGGLWESTDGGETWLQTQTALPSSSRFGFNPGSIVAHPRVSNLWFAGVEKHGVYRSRDAGQSWEQINVGLGKEHALNGVSFTFHATDNSTVYYGSDGGLFRSSDCGNHWTKCTRGLPKGDLEHPGTTVSRLATDPKSGTLYAAYYGVGSNDVPGAYRSTNEGETWELINNGIAAGPDEEMLKMIKANSERMADRKVDDTLIANFPVVDKAWSYDLQISPTNPSVLFIATNRTLYRTDDGGKHWFKCEHVTMPRSIAFHPTDSNTVVASGWQNIWISRDGGVTWRDFTTGLNDPPKPTKPPKIIDLGNGLKGQFAEMSDMPFTPEFLTFAPDGKRLFALTSQGLWIASETALK